MEAISYSYADKAQKRIKKIINDPDSTSGVVTVPSTIASGETITIPAGRTAILPNVQIDGTLNVEGTVFIPTGSKMSQVVEKVASTDNAIVRFDGTTGAVQNSGVIIDDNGNLLVTLGTGGIGYGTGSGGTVTQLTSKSTVVTLNKPSGIITMNGAALAAGASVLFPFYNSTVTYNDQFIVNMLSVVSGHNNYKVENAGAIGDGGNYIRLTNISDVSLSDAISIVFTVLKGANS